MEGLRGCPGELSRTWGRFLAHFGPHGDVTRAGTLGIIFQKLQGALHEIITAKNVPWGPVDRGCSVTWSRFLGNGPQNIPEVSSEACYTCYPLEYGYCSIFMDILACSHSYYTCGGFVATCNGDSGAFVAQSLDTGAQHDYVAHGLGDRTPHCSIF